MWEELPVLKIISATGYTGAGNFKLYVSNTHAAALWNAVLEAGEPHGLLPVSWSETLAP